MEKHARKRSAAETGQGAGQVTVDAILDAAERLFAERTYAEVSLRDITAEAGVNLASVNYHFGSKENLLLALFKRAAQTLNRERMRLLKDAEDNAHGTPSVRALLRALLEPGIRFTLQSNRLTLYNQVVTLARTGASQEMRELLERDVRHLQRFVTAIERALPDMPRDEIVWRLHFVMGVQHSIYSELPRLEALSEGRCNVTDIDAVVARAINFAVAGFESSVEAQSPLA